MLTCSTVRRRQEGFTLAELMVSIGIGSLLLSVGVPSYTTVTQNARQVSSSNELLSNLHFAREMSITRNVRVTLCPSSSGNDCEAVDWTDGWILFLDNDGDQAVDAGETVERFVDGLGALDVSSAEFGEFLIYRPNGRIMVNNVRDNSGAFTLCDGRGAGHARVVIIDISGRPRVSYVQEDGSPPVCG